MMFFRALPESTLQTPCEQPDTVFGFFPILKVFLLQLSASVLKVKLSPLIHIDSISDISTKTVLAGHLSPAPETSVILLTWLYPP